MGLRVWGLGLRVRGVGLRVWGFVGHVWLLVASVGSVFAIVSPAVAVGLLGVYHSWLVCGVPCASLCCSPVAAKFAALAVVG